MEDILAMRRKNSPNSPSKIKELLSQISNAHVESDKFSCKLKDNEFKIYELSKEVTTLKEEFELEKQNLEKRERESEEHLHLLQSLIKDKENLNISLKDLETRYKTTKRTKPSLKDEQLLEKGKRKFKLYKEFTGIRWDYTSPETSIEGYITNMQDYLQKILFKGDIDYKSVKEILWKDIQQSTRGSLLREECKENKPLNN